MVMLAFVTEKQALNSQYPAIDFGAACGGQTDVMMREAPGLLSCPELAGDILSCQEVYGKKVCLVFFFLVCVVLSKELIFGLGEGGLFNA